MSADTTEAQDRLRDAVEHAEARFKQDFDGKTYWKDIKRSQDVKEMIGWTSWKGHYRLVISSESRHDDCASVSRIKDLSGKQLIEWADRIQDFWNYCNELKKQEMIDFDSSSDRLWKWLGD